MSRKALRPELPRKLLEQISPSSLNGRKPNSVSGRKAHRKAIRSQKKAIRSGSSRRNVRVSAEQVDELSEEESHEVHEPVKQASQKPISRKRKRGVQQEDEKMVDVEEEMTEEEDDNDGAFKIKPNRRALEDDDAEIKRLEKKLGIKGNTGNDSVLKDLDNLFGDGVEDEMEDSDDEGQSAEYKDWLASKRAKSKATIEDEYSESEEMNVIANEGNEYDDESDFDGLDDGTDDRLDDELDTGFDDGLDDELDDEEEWLNSPNQVDEIDEIKKAPRIRENPYKPPVSTNIEKYIPPSLRVTAQDSQSTAQLQRQLQGMLNKLSESNILGIVKEVEQVLLKNARQEVISILIDLLMTLLEDKASLSDAFLILHVAFISTIYKIVGPHFGGQLVQRIVDDYFRVYENERMNSVGSKEAHNLVGLLAWLYGFQVISCHLIFDQLKLLLSELTELNTDLLLRMIKCCGPQLRKDDPNALKDVVILLQKAVAEQGEASLSVRTKFMIESISDLKNNRIKASQNSEESSRQLVRLKKAVGTMAERHFHATEPLSVGLQDIQQADKRGRWWLVGASYKSSEDHQKADQKENRMEVDKEDNLWEQAKSQGMNTDVKRSIFVAIQSAVDYQHALIQLRKVPLKTKQQLEIPVVLLHLAGSTDSYTPFYRVIAENLCTEHRYRKAFQFSLWNIFRQLGERDSINDKVIDYNDSNQQIDKRRLLSLAKFYGELIGNSKLSITILKNLDFAHLQPKTRMFLEFLLVTLFASIKVKDGGEQESVTEIFEKAAEDPRDMIGLQVIISQQVPSSVLLGAFKPGKRANIVELAATASQILQRLAVRIGV